MAQKVKNKKDQVEEDEIIYEEETGKSSDSAGSGDGRSFFQKYQNFIFGGILVIVAVIFFGNRLGWFGANEEQELEVASDLIAPQYYYEADSVQRAIQMFSELEGGLGNTKSANVLRYYLGTSYLRTGNLAEGVSYLEEYKKGDNLTAAATYAALGFAAEEQGNFAEAAENYEKAAVTPEANEYFTPWFYMEAARNHESNGDNESALELYKKIKYNYPNSEEARGVDRYIGRLTGGVLND